MTPPRDPAAVALLVTSELDRLGIPHTIGGSIASSFAGEPRSTVDVDIIAAIEPQHIEPLVTALAGSFYVEAAALRRAVAARSTANLIHQDTQIKIDLFVAGGTPLDHQQIARRLPVRLGSGRTLHIHPPEDVLLQKLRWYALSQETSDRQWRDILGILRVQGPRLDRAYLRTNAPVLGVDTLLERALHEGGPDASRP